MNAPDLCSATCNGKDQRAYRFAMTQKFVVACAFHAAWLEGQGLTLIPTERRQRVEPVAHDRRRVMWLRVGRLARVIADGRAA